MIEDKSSSYSSKFKKAIEYVFFLSIFLMPLNRVETLPYFAGELSFVPSLLLYLIIIPLFFIGFPVIKYRFPSNKLFCILILLLLIFIASGVFNFNEIRENSTNLRNGPERFVKQLAVFVFSLMTVVVVYNIFLGNWKSKFNILSLVILVSFIFMVVYSFFELGYIFFREENYLKVKFWFDKFIRTKIDPFSGRNLKIRSLCHESSWFGTYMAFAFPFLFYYFYLFKKNLIIYLIFIFTYILLCYFSFSRTVYFIAVFQASLFFVFLLLYSIKSKNNLKKPAIFLMSILAFTSLALLIDNLKFKDDYGIKISSKKVVSAFHPESFKTLANENNKKRKSNMQISGITRIGSWVTGFNAGLDNPLFGVGLGQYTFVMKDYVPSWAKNSWEIREYVKAENIVPAHNLHTRLMAEAGIPGVVFWLFFWTSCTVLLFQRMDFTRGDNYNYSIMTMLAAVSGCVLIGFNDGTLRHLQYWVTAGIIIAFIDFQGSEDKQAEFMLVDKNV